MEDFCHKCCRAAPRARPRATQASVLRWKTCVQGVIEKIPAPLKSSPIQSVIQKWKIRQWDNKCGRPFLLPPNAQLVSIQIITLWKQDFPMRCSVVEIRVTASRKQVGWRDQSPAEHWYLPLSLRAKALRSVKVR